MMERVVTRLDNRPPEPIVVSADELKKQIETDYADLFKRFTELEIGIDQVPKEIPDEPAAQRIIDFVAQQIRPLTAKAKQDHDRLVKPYNTAANLIHEFFLRRIDRINNKSLPLFRRAEEYIKRKAEEQRRREAEQRRQAEEWKRAAEAEALRLAAEAKAKVAEGERKAAVELQRQAEAHLEHANVAARIVAAPPAPVRIHGDYGATAFTVEKWTFAIMDPAKVPQRYWLIDEKLIQRDVDQGVRDIPGVEITRNDRFQIRRC